jgi:hypothetical protein
VRVIVDAAVFDDPGDDALALLDVLVTGVEGRHVVVIDPPLRTNTEARTAFTRWVERLLAPGGSIARSLTEHYLRAATRDDRVTVQTVVRVVVSQRSAWNTTPPCVTPEDARRLVREPLAIILEDAVNDGAFLLTLSEVAGDAGRRLRERLSRSWLRVAHGGGISSIPRLLRALDEVPVQRLRCQVVVDHD